MEIVCSEGNKMAITTIGESRSGSLCIFLPILSILPRISYDCAIVVEINPINSSRRNC